ncbi:MAG: substrate-binding domain-containing protein, partial [Verrucomicrobia bacterium]|nr:substrate-binding domain-containing protein [Verrucomicrobiota bacterium]
HHHHRLSIPPAGCEHQSHFYRSGPKSILSLTSPEWKDKVCMAYPLYGTTATQFQVLRHRLGDTPWKNFCHGLRANNPLVVDGNSHVVKLVGSGQRAIGLTDTDDVRVGQERGFPIAAWPDAQSDVRIFNSISIVKGAPHPSEAGELAAYLASEKVSQALIAAGAADGLPDHSGRPVTEPDWSAVLAGIEDASRFLKQTFLSP